MGGGLRKAQSTLEYAALIAVVIGVFLAMQVYLKRGMQGQMVAGSDQIADQYGYGLTNSHEHYETHASEFEMDTAGINNPTKFTWEWGDYQSTSDRSLKPIGQTWSVDDVQ